MFSRGLPLPWPALPPVPQGWGTAAALFFNYNFRDRKARKGDFRKLRIQRINAAVRAEGITYNRFIQGLRLAGIELDRRALAEIAVSDPDTFKTIVDAAKAALPEDVNAPVEA